MTAKNPRTPPTPLTMEEGDLTSVQHPLWRIHRVSGAHPSTWDELREHGPVTSMRWDPHPTPRGDHPGIGVSYASADVFTVVAEAFQQQRVITLSRERALVGWTPTRPLRLLRVSGEWAIRNGASASLHAAPRSTCRAWAREIHHTWPDLDGLDVPSTMTGTAMTVLFSHAATAFPPSPAVSATLDQRVAAALIVPVARRFRWPVTRA
ncbi:RES family NAD+ phosphorylase [Microbacterium wangchenii]|nr:RES family NAD+ phosphorylase [Microbacterium wangchenii]